MSFLDAEEVRTTPMSEEEQRRSFLIGSILSYSAVFIGYLTMYLVRKDFNIAQPYLKEIHHFTNSQLGLIAAAFTIPYGIGKVVLGIYADQKNAKRIVGVMLLLAGICNILFGFVLGSIGLMMALWALNGFTQSCGGPASYATIARWFPQKNRGTALGFWNVSHNVGGALAATVAILGLTLFAQRIDGMFVIPGMIAVVVSMYVMFVGNSRPEARGLPSVEEFYGEHEEKEKNDEANKMSPGEILRRYVLNNRFVWILCAANVFVYVIRIGLDQWVTVYLPSIGFTKQQASTGFTIFEMSAIPGTFFWGYLSDRLKGRRALVCLMCFFPLMLVLWIYSHATDLTTIYVCLGLMGCLIFGPQLLIGVSIVDFVPKRAVASANGLSGTFGYLGGDLFAKVLLGRISDVYGWNLVFSAMGFSIVCGICLMSLILIEENRRLRTDTADTLRLREELELLDEGAQPLA